MKKEDIDAIVIHCSATRAGQDVKAADIDKQHKERGFKMIGYHYVIDLDGTIENGRPITMNGAHCNTKGLSNKPYNSHSIGICLIGGLDPLPFQLRIPSFSKFYDVFPILPNIRLHPQAIQLPHHYSSQKVRLHSSVPRR